MPAFDARTGTWFVERPTGIATETRSLREMQARHPRAVIVGYAPTGYGDVRYPATPQAGGRPSRPEPEAAVKKERAEAAPVPAPAEPSNSDSVVAPSPVAPAPVVAPAAGRPPPKAPNLPPRREPPLPRPKADIVRHDKAFIGRVLAMSATLSYAQIAGALGTTRNAVSGIVDRAKRRGDPRLHPDER